MNRKTGKTLLLTIIFTALTAVSAFADTKESSQTLDQAAHAAVTTLLDATGIPDAGKAAEAAVTAAQSGEYQADLTEEDDTEAEEAADDAIAKAASEPQQNLVSLGVFRLTGYCPCRKCSEGWGRHTSSGAIATSGRTVAVDKRVIPIGTRLMINGHEYVAEDVGGGVKGNHIDVFFDTHGETRQLGPPPPRCS